MGKSFGGGIGRIGSTMSRRLGDSLDKTVLFNGMTHRPNRPEPLSLTGEVAAVRHHDDLKLAAEMLVDGEYVLVADFYSTGLAVLEKVKQLLSGKSKNQQFLEQRSFRSAYREASQHLLLEIEGNRLVVRKAPEIGWLVQLYPDCSDFILSFPDVQGLNSAWQWYLNGIKIPLLKQKLHPFYGVYFPTRYDHLKLFDGWLRKYMGAKGVVYDIGVGSGVLTLQLLQHGFGRVLSTDINPNAIIGMEGELQRRGVANRVNLLYGDLFANSSQLADLVVFNPPWLPAMHEPTWLDAAIYYPTDLFSRFFEQAAQHLAPGGQVVILFSSLAQTVGAAAIHPVEEELAKGGRFTAVAHLIGRVKAASSQTRRNLHRRQEEQVELWVLQLLQ